QAAGLLLQLRQKWHSLFLRRMRAPSKSWSQADEATVRAVVTVLTAEEQSAGLQQPSGIGQRPRSLASEDHLVARTWRPTNTRRSTAETEFSDSSNAGKVPMSSTRPILHPPKKYKQKNILRSKQTSDDRSDRSSAKSADSSSFPSPCASPCYPISGK
ncbi:YTDC2 helicase, partial [Cercotrichas coryphoeus]|nr:YTDC2 helicase [Cercotrichas coryphoeus]